MDLRRRRMVESVLRHVCRVVYSISLFAVLLFVCANARAETSRKIEIRFCPGSALRSYPMDVRRELQSVLLQNAAVINHETATFKIENVNDGAEDVFATLFDCEDSVNRALEFRLRNAVEADGEIRELSIS